MSLLGKKFNAPFAKPLAPFFFAGTHMTNTQTDARTGLIMMYGINSFGNTLMNTDEFKNDPRNPNAGKAQKPAEKH
ncbi:ATP synthase subunit J, mitochondrial [Lachnellula hyalina]|uniref:ATP synthase subunit J, mitochondrial n=1 Tax=Lachnellula hyalina TaxID=1316788 RepID=A0A8H8TWS8_9HELO|nr:ATP synthase subunit J, mitochondrial [Lachnellula hyalina]TVY22271.1 ATP synthase subunit J, mitochondrial [Lachnellula hyalina]